MSQVPTLTLDGDQDGATVLLDINNILFALASMNAGDEPPPGPSLQPYSWWFDSNDTSKGGTGIIRLRNRANDGWINVFNVVSGGMDGIEVLSRNAPVLSAGVANTFTASPQLIVPVSAVGELILGSQLGGGGVTGRLGFRARDDASADRDVIQLEADTVNDAALNMSVQLKLASIVQNTLATRFRLGASLFADGLTDQGSGAVNATELYRNDLGLDAIIAAADIRAVDVQALGAGATYALNLSTFLHFLDTFTGDRTLAFQNTTGKIGRMGILSLTASGGDRTITLGNDFGVNIGGDFSSGADLVVDSGTSRRFIFLVRNATQVDVFEFGSGGLTSPQGFSNLIETTIDSAQSGDDFLRMQDISEGETQLITIHEIQQTNNANSTILIRVSSSTTQRTSGYKNRGDLGNSSADTGCRILRVSEINDRGFGKLLVRRTNGVLWVDARTMTSEFLSAGGDTEGVWTQAATYAGGQAFDRWYFDVTNSPNSIATGSKYSVRRNWL